MWLEREENFIFYLFHSLKVKCPKLKIEKSVLAMLRTFQGFPGGSVVKKKVHLPNVGDTRFNPRVGKLPNATEQLSPCSTTTKPMFQSPCVRACMLVAQSCPTLCDPMDCSPPGFSVHGILQARILEWTAIPFSTRAHELQLKTSRTATTEARAPESPCSITREAAVVRSPCTAISSPCSSQLEKSPHSIKMAKNQSKNK